MSDAVTDSGLLHYLVLIDAIGILPRLFGTVVMADAVRRELAAPAAPTQVRAWVASSPLWLASALAPHCKTSIPAKLGKGERATIAVAIEMGVEMVLMDDRAAVAVARWHGLNVIGTLGILARGAALGLIDLPEAIAALKATNFRARPALLEAVLARRRRV